MHFLKGLGQIVGIAMIVVGLLWIGQGFGVIRWPASSFMIGDMVWARNGAILAIAGGLLLRFTRRS